MRIRILSKRLPSSIEGIDLQDFQYGNQYDVGTTLAGVLLAQGWAEPVADPEPALVIPLGEFKADALIKPVKLEREVRLPHERRRSPRRYVLDESNNS